MPRAFVADCFVVGETGWAIHSPRNPPKGFGKGARRGQKFGIAAFGLEGPTLAATENRHGHCRVDNDALTNPSDAVGRASNWTRKDFVGNSFWRMPPKIKKPWDKAWSLFILKRRLSERPPCQLVMNGQLR